MAKTLISFLGTGSIGNNNKYRKAIYKIDNETYETSYVAMAIRKHYRTDKMILVGTVKSMWDEVYASMAGDDYDEKIHMDLMEDKEKACKDSKLELRHKEEIEKVMGENSKIVLINYGLDDEEIGHNDELILSLEDYLYRKDELYIDVTHAFRSLPLFLMNTMIYLKNVSDKNIDIKQVTYGMLDVSREIGYAPVVNLRSIVDTNEWISAAYSFREFGNAYKIASLIENEDKSMAKILRNFSDALNLNSLYQISKQYQRISGLKNYEYKSPIAQMVIKPGIDKFLSSFGEFDELNVAEFQYKVARWHYEHKSYCLAYNDLLEAMVTYCCEHELPSYGRPWYDYDFRKESRKWIKSEKSNCGRELSFKKLNAKRNGLVHQNEIKENTDQLINNLERYLDEFANFLKSNK